jgi:hypothetical protein
VSGRGLTVGLCKLDIIVGAMKLDDQFEWDVYNDRAFA